MSTLESVSLNGTVPAAVAIGRRIDGLIILVIERDEPLRLALQCLLRVLDSAWTVKATGEIPADPGPYDVVVFSNLRSCAGRCDLPSGVAALEWRMESPTNSQRTLGLGEAPHLLRQKIRRAGRRCEERGFNGLSDRQVEILQMIGRGHTLIEIATRLRISRKTVDSHRENIKNKLGLATAADLREFARWQNSQPETEPEKK